jgi:hypothetical protein
LGPKDLLVYTYRIIPKKCGDINTNTIVETYDSELAPSPTIYYEKALKICDPIPQFEVVLRRANSYVYENEPLRVPIYLH